MPRDPNRPGPQAVKPERPKDDPTKPGRELISDDGVRAVYVVRDAAGKVIGRDVTTQPTPPRPDTLAARRQELAVMHDTFAAAMENWQTLKPAAKDTVMLAVVEAMAKITRDV